MRILYYPSILSIFILFVSLFFTSFYEYGAESVFISALLQIAQEQSYATDLSEFPVLINPYSPYFFELFKPFFSLSGISGLKAVSWVGRLFMLGLILSCYFALKSFYQNQFQGKGKKYFMEFFFFTFIFIFSSTAFSVRVDFLAILFELLGFITFYNYYFSKKQSLNKIILSALFLSLAVLFKANAVRVLMGLSIFLLFERKVVFAFLYGLAVVTFFAIMSLFTIYFVDQEFLFNFSLGLKQPFSSSLYEMFYKVQYALKTVFLQKIIFYAITGLGLYYLKPRVRKLFICVMACAFFLATFGQLRNGGSFNYYYLFYLVSAIPFILGLEQLILDKTKVGKVFLAVAVFSFVFQLLLAFRVPYNIWEYNSNHPFKEMKEYVATHLPSGYIYSDSNNMLLHFEDRALLLPWAEAQIRDIPSLRKQFKVISKELDKKPFVAAIISGRECELWEPHGILMEHIKSFTKLDKKIKDLCLFVRHE